MAQNGEEAKLKEAKKKYSEFAAERNKEKEAKWASVVGNILKDMGEYDEALKWLLIDYNFSVNFLPKKQLLHTCHSLGEVYLRCHSLETALFYQKKHLELAKDSNNIVEQQRASTQLGRTYHEKFLKSDNDHISARTTKEYFQSAMNLAKTLWENSQTDCTSFAKEYIDAHNNLGMLEIDLDNLGKSQKILIKGLQICEEEEIGEDDDVRTRLHHNLGKVYLELRKWDDARVHIDKDIKICNRIGNCHGEAKGYLNLGVLQYGMEEHDEAICCYEKALKLAANSREDSDAFADQILRSIGAVKEAKSVSDELKNEEENLKNLVRNMPNGIGKQKNLLQQDSCLDRLIEKSRMISAWFKHLYYATEKMRVATELSDKERLSDSFVLTGDSFQKLKNFKEALQWYQTSWESYKSIGNLEGQAISKINAGNVLDYDGNWKGALSAFEEGYGIALQANLLSVQLTALENMHYSHIIRFDNVVEARRVQLQIEKLKQTMSTEHEMSREHENQHVVQYGCSVKDIEGDNLQIKKSPTQVEGNENMHTISCKHVEEIASRCNVHNSPPINFGKHNQLLGRKRIRGAHKGVISSIRWHHQATIEDVASPHKVKRRDKIARHASKFQDESVGSSNYSPINPEKIIRAYMKSSQKLVQVKIEEVFVHVDLGSCMVGGKISLECMKAEVACLYYLHLPAKKISEGQLPEIEHMRCGGRALDTLEEVGDLESLLCENEWIDVTIKGWVQKNLIKHYIDCCNELSEFPNLKLINKLYNLKVSTEEIVAPGCKLQDASITPLINALKRQKYFGILDLSHNLLENGTVKKVLKALPSDQIHGGLFLDFHQNVLDSCSLCEMSICPLLFSRLEVLNLSGNPLTDACGYYLSIILNKCKALYSLNVERCSITSRTIQKIADALHSDSVLYNIAIGYNNPVSAPTIISLLEKLATLKRFSELNLSGLNLGKSELSTLVVDRLCQLTKSIFLSELILGETSLGTEYALQLTRSSDANQYLMKLDLSSCGLTSQYVVNMNANISMILSLDVLILGGNPIMQEGGNAISLLLKNPNCCLRVLMLNKCQLGLLGVVTILKALSQNHHLEELNLAENVNTETSPSDTSSNIPVPIEIVAAAQKKISTAIAMAKQLKLLDLSDNMLSKEIVEVLYAGWSSRSRTGLSQRHIKKNIIHFSVQDIMCCGVKPCCRKIF